MDATRSPAVGRNGQQTAAPPKPPDILGLKGELIKRAILYVVSQFTLLLSNDCITIKFVSSLEYIIVPATIVLYSDENYQADIPTFHACVHGG